LYQRLAEVVDGFPHQLYEMVVLGGVFAGEPSSDESGRLMVTRGVLLARLVVAVSRVDPALPSQQLPPEMWEAEAIQRQWGLDVWEAPPFSLAKMEVGLALRTIVQVRTNTQLSSMGIGCKGEF
jgi:hypothetical protein